MTPPQQLCVTAAPSLRRVNAVGPGPEPAYDAGIVQPPQRQWD